MKRQSGASPIVAQRAFRGDGTAWTLAIPTLNFRCHHNGSAQLSERKRIGTTERIRLDKQTVSRLSRLRRLASRALVDLTVDPGRVFRNGSLKEKWVFRSVAAARAVWAGALNHLAEPVSDETRAERTRVAVVRDLIFAITRQSDGAGVLVGRADEAIQRIDRGSLTETRLSVLSYAWLDAPMNFRSRPSSSNTAVWESCSVPPESLIRRAVAFPSLSRSYSTQAPLLS